MADTIPMMADGISATAIAVARSVFLAARGYRARYLVVGETAWRRYLHENLKREGLTEALAGLIEDGVMRVMGLEVVVLPDELAPPGNTFVVTGGLW